MTNQNPFTIKPLNQWIEEAASRPDPRSLFGDFWLEGELAVLFSDAGKGKSLLGVQIADSIARGKPINLVPMTAKPRKVLYFDFEFSAKQFEMRYSADESLKDPYRFPKNFHRAEPAEGSPPYEGGVRLQPGGGSLSSNPQSQIPIPKLSDGVVRNPAELAELEDAIRASRARVVVIDSMAWLQGPNITARHTVPLMRELKRLQSTLGLSILVLAHNPRRDTSRPLTISGLHGAGVICNFADSVFAIGQSRIDNSFRYIKHIKSRSTELTCDEKNVLVGEIRKWEKNFLSFRFYKFRPESDHLVRELNPMIEERAEMIKEMSDGGMTQREIAAKLGISLGSVNRYLQMAREDEDYFELDDGFVSDDDEPDPETDKQVHAYVKARTQELQTLAEERRRKSSPPAVGGVPAVSAGGAVGVSPGFPPDQINSVDSVNSANPANRLDDGEPAACGSPRVAKRRSKCAELDPVSSPTVMEGAELGKLGKLGKLGQLGKLPYKTLDDKIEVGDIVQDRNGQLMKRTFWGWDLCANSLK
jgi:predicted transcriptional regulator